MIQCKLCRHKSKYRLIEHIIKTHKMSIEEYKKKYGDVITNEYHNKVSNKSKKMWKNENYREKTISSRKYDEHWKKKLKSGIQNFIKENPNFKTWNVGLTKYDDKRLESIGKKNKKHLTGRTKDNYKYLDNHSKFMKKRLREYWGENGILTNYYKDKDNFNNWRNKISKTISDKCKNGELNYLSGHFKTGYYRNKFYRSGLELEAMKFFDICSYIKKWETNFDVIEYVDVDGINRRYLPDFKLTLITDDILIIETKGYVKDEKKEIQKQIYAKKKYKNIMCANL